MKSSLRLLSLAARLTTLAAIVTAASGATNAAPSGGKQACCELVTAYLPIADALAADDFPKARSAAAVLAKQADADGMTTISQPAVALAHARDITAARAAFKTLSNEVTPLVDGHKDYVVIHCPMADADWVQTDAKVRNPYYGKMMLTCGEPKKSGKQ